MGNKQPITNKNDQQYEVTLPQKNVIMVGLDETGKTTILQKLSSSMTRREPIDGFTVEHINYKNLSINSWNIGINDENIKSEWDALLKMTYRYIDGIIFVIDSTDRIRIDNVDGFFWNTAKRHFDMLLEEEYVNDATILILCNKQDIESNDKMSINTINKKLELNTLRNRQWYIQSCSCIDNNDNGILKGIEWLLDTINNNKYYIKSELKSIILVSGYIHQIDKKYKLMSNIPIEIIKFIHLLYKNPDYDYDQYKYYGEYENNDNDNNNNNNYHEPILLMQFLNRKDDNNCLYIDDDEKFIQSLNGQKLKLYHLNDDDKKWNHYNFMRMIWILFKFHDRRNGLKMIFKYSPYSVTKTYFWSQLIYFGMNRDNDNNNNNNNNLCKQDFQYFLIMNPSFSNDFDILMNKYYSNKLLNKMNNKENENEMILPDLLSLPSIITNIKKIKVKIKSNRNYKRFKEKDEDFLINFENKTFKSWEGHTSFLRVIWCYINKLQAQYTSIIQKKWKQFDSYNYNMTKTYFWIHIMRYYIKLYKQEKDNNHSDEKDDDEWSFEGFLNFCNTKYKCRIEYDLWWKEYYSQTLIQNTARNKLVFPDLKQLPHV